MAPLAAQEYGFAVNAGVGYSDNVTRTVFDPEAASAGIVGLELSAFKDTGRLTYEGLGDLSYIKYFQTELADDDVVGNLDLRSRYEIVENRFGWSIADSYTQLRENFLLPASPNNRQGFNQLTTGPDLRLQFGGAYEFIAEGRYSRSDYESSSEFDAQRYMAQAELRRELGQRSAVGVRASQERFEYADTGVIVADQEFDRSEYAVRLDITNTRNELMLEAGVTAVKGDTLDESGPLARIELRRRISPALTLSLDGAREFSTTGERPRQFRADDAPGVNDDLILPSAEPFEQTRGGLNLLYSRPRTEWSIGADYVREEYEVTTALNRELIEYRADITRILSPRLRIGLSAARGEDQLEGLAYDVTDSQYRFNLRWRITMGLSVVAIAERFERDGSIAGLFDYEEFSARLLLRWVPGASGASAPAEEVE